MSAAAAERAALTAVGRDLVAVAGSRRAAAWLAPDDATMPGGFADLTRVPAWLRGDREGQTRLARVVALFALAPALAASIDGAWLGRIARAVGERALDRAVAAAAATPGGGLPAVAAERLDPLGFDLLRATLPAALWRYLDWAPTAGERPSLVVSRHALDQALTVPVEPEAASGDRDMAA